MILIYYICIYKSELVILQLTNSDYQGNLTAPFAAIVGGFFIMEIWKPVKGYEDLYEVSSLGRINSLFTRKGKIMKPKKERDGYLRIGFWKEGKQKYYNVHRLVAEAFLPIKEDYQNQINHINKIKFDNRVENLEWVSNIENHFHKNINNNTTSKYVGVAWSKIKNKWASYINFENKKVHLGHFNNENLAHEARLKFQKEKGIKNKYLNTETVITNVRA